VKASATTTGTDMDILPILGGLVAAFVLSRGGTAEAQPVIELRGPVMIYGDSQASAYGFGGGWADAVKQRGFTATNRNNDGKSTRWLWQNAPSQFSPASYDTVIVIAGANDGSNDYQGELQSMISWLFHNGTRQVVYIPPLPLTVATDPEYLARVFPNRTVTWALEGDWLRNRNANHAALTRGARAAGAIIVDPEALAPYPDAPDGIHATRDTGRMYAEIVLSQ